MRVFVLAGAILLGSIVAAFGASDPVIITLNGQDVSSGNPLPVTLNGAAFAAAGAAQPVIITYNGAPVSGTNPLPVTIAGGGGVPGGSTGTIQYNAGSSTFGGITDWSTSGTSDLTGASGSTLAVGGCTIGSSVFCVTGLATFNGDVLAAHGVVVSGISTTSLSNDAAIDYLNPNLRFSLPSTEGYLWYNQGRGTNLLATLNSSGLALTGTETSAGMIATAVAPTVSANQIGYGSTTAAVSNCGSLATACIVVNVAGTAHYVPYY